jgi:protein TonB
LIEPKGLVTRLAEELARAASELGSDPAGFVRSLVSADNKDAQRRRLIYAGLALALVAHVVFLAVAVIAGWHRIMAPVKEDKLQVTMLNPTKALELTEHAPPDKPLGQKNGGGGGGGQTNPLPASKGHLPQSVPQPPVVNLNPSNISNPLLAVAPIVQGLEGPPPPPGQIGDPNSKASETSGGPGTGDGIGNNRGSGVGNGDGSGAGPGGKGGKGGGKPGYPDGTGNGIAEVNFSNLASYPGYTPFIWVRRPTPVITPEAQANKVIGDVLLRATFHADGTFSDIEVVRRVDYMTESAVDSLMRSRFKPATVNGKPITVRKVLVVIKVHY